MGLIKSSENNYKRYIIFFLNIKRKKSYLDHHAKTLIIINFTLLYWTI